MYFGHSNMLVFSFNASSSVLFKKVMSSAVKFPKDCQAYCIQADIDIERVSNKTSLQMKALLLRFTDICNSERVQKLLYFQNQLLEQIGGRLSRNFNDLAQIFKRKMIPLSFRQLLRSCSTSALSLKKVFWKEVISRSSICFSSLPVAPRSPWAFWLLLFIRILQINPLLTITQPLYSFIPPLSLNLIQKIIRQDESQRDKASVFCNYLFISVSLFSGIFIQGIPIQLQSIRKR